MLKSMRDLYDSEVADLLVQFHRSSAYQTHVAACNKSAFENQLLASNTFTDSNLEAAASQFLFENEDIANCHIGLREQMRDTVVRNMRALHGQMCEAIRLVRGTSMKRDRVQVYQRLVQREQSDERIFASVAEHSAKMSATVETLRADRQQLEHDLMAQLAGIKQEKEYYMECFLLVRQHYEEDMRNDERNTRRVVNAANISLDVRPDGTGKVNVRTAIVILSILPGSTLAGPKGHVDSQHLCIVPQARNRSGESDAAVR